MSASEPRKFTFDTVFDARGGAYTPPRPKRAFTPEEVEAIRAEAYSEGQASAIVRAEEMQAAALNACAQGIHQALSSLSAVAHSHRTDSANLALAVGRSIAGAALERFPEAPAAEAMAALARELEAAPKVVVRLPVEDSGRVRKALEEAATRAGFPGRLAFSPEAGFQPAAFVFDWGDGRAAFDPDAAAARVAEALATALAVEGLHAEPPLPSEEQTL